MAIAIDVRDCASRGRRLGGGFKGSGVAPGAGSAPTGRGPASTQPSRGMPRVQQVRRIGRQETHRIARNVRTLFAWPFCTLADAPSYLGRWGTFRRKLEAIGV